MKFKEEHLAKEFAYSPILLKIIFEDADQYCQNNFGKELTVTRILGKIAGDSGVHADHRAIDARNQHSGIREFTDEEVKRILHYVNSRYYRNDGLSSVIHHSFNNGPYHFHFQISLNTKTYMPTS